jgi:hypothetical protein
MLWVRANDIEIWANLIPSRYTLPQLIRKLVHGTCEDVRLIEFPAAEGAQRPGWDGIIDAPQGNAFVPAGVSVWECGVDKDIKGKADEDFDTRVDDPLGLTTKDVSYIFVTPRKWSTKAKWAKAKNALGIWKEVRVYDSANLEEWLETAPAVDAWMAFLMQKRPTGIVDISTYWENLAAITKPPLTPGVFLTSRDSEVTFLTDWLTTKASVVAYESRSPNDVIDFIAAFVASQGPAAKDLHEARIVVVEKPESWNVLASSANAVTLIPKPNLTVEPEMVSEAIRSGHRVILCSERFAKRGAMTRNLPRPYQFELREALLKSGFDLERADRLSRESRGNLTVLKRRSTSLPTTSQPAWSEPQNAASLLPVLLAGGWDDANVADREIMASLSDGSYDRVLESANHWLVREDPPLLRIGSARSLTSREDSWELLAPFLTRDYLERFDRVALDVLGEEDPAFDLEPDKRWETELFGKQRRYSGVLRKGLAETTALLGAKADKVPVHDFVSTAFRAERLVGRLFPAEADWKRWASMSPYLTLFAEAAPHVFLDRIEQDLKKPQPQLVEMFKAEGESHFSSPPHTGLLWALESLTWNRTTFARSCLILANLAQHDRGGRWSNRPDASLKSIFLPWLPQGTATLDERSQVLTQLIKKYPVVGWKLALALLPNMHSHTSSIARPSWRDWGEGWTPRVLEVERTQLVNAVVDRLIANVGKTAERWTELIGHIENFPKEAQERILIGLESFNQDELSPESQRIITAKLRDKVHRHREFADAQWALPSQFVDKLEALEKAFEPRELVARFSWLFDRFVRLSPSLSWEERPGRVFEAQKEAVTYILREDGWDRVLALAAAAEDAHSVGFIVGKLALNTDEAILPSLLCADAQSHRSLAIGFAVGRFAEGGWNWVSRLGIDKWPSQEAATLCLVLPFERSTWTFLERLGSGVAENYWTQVMSLGIHLSEEDIDFVVDQLIKHSRPLQATVAIDDAMYSQKFLGSSKLLDVLEAGLKPRGDELNGSNLANVTHSIHRLFERLQGDESCDQDRLAMMEWAYLPMFELNGIDPKTLLKRIGENAGFFAELVEAGYGRPIKKTDGSDEDGQGEGAARNARLLLESLNILPGRSQDEIIDAEFLRGWVEQARTVCDSKGVRDACDTAIGLLLANEPEPSADEQSVAEESGSKPDEESRMSRCWPSIPVRDVIESIDNEHVADGFETGIRKKRSEWNKTLTEGGAQEWALARRYEDYAKHCDIGWPASAKSLRNVANYFASWARSEDERLQLE